MNYTLPEVKKELKAMKSVQVIKIHMEEFGEGYNTYLGVVYHDEQEERQFEVYEIGEEDKQGKARTRIKRFEESLTKLGYKVKKENLFDC